MSNLCQMMMPWMWQIKLELYKLIDCDLDFDLTMRERETERHALDKAHWRKERQNIHPCTIFYNLMTNIPRFVSFVTIAFGLTFKQVTRKSIMCCLSFAFVFV